MIFARIAVAGAILCSLWFNASYAWHKAPDLPQQLAQVSLALTIDLCKCGFLPAASLLWQAGRTLAAAVLVALFPLCLILSMFAGFAAITTNRASTTVASQTTTEARARAQATYDQATADLATAKKAALWTETAACTAPKATRQRTFCNGVAKAQADQRAASDAIGTAPAIAVDPELAVLTQTTGWSTATLLLLVSLVPALLIELVSSLGLYAVTQPLATKRHRRPVQRHLRWRAVSHRPRSETPTKAAVVAPVPHAAAPPLPARPPIVIWPSLPPANASPSGATP